MQVLAIVFVSFSVIVSLHSSAMIMAVEQDGISVSLIIDDASTGPSIPSTMHGVILETNINRGDDGGLYAELIYNRIFQENSGSLDGWLSYGQGSISIDVDQPLSWALPIHLKFSIASQSTTGSGFVNSGFQGMRIDATTYTVNFFYKPSMGAIVANKKLTVGFRDVSGEIVYGTTDVDVSSASAGNWSKLSALVNVPNAAPSSMNNFFIEFPVGSQGNFSFNLISCFPPTYRNRVNGARVDIAQAFADLKPGYVRLPGGNDLEGPSIAERFIWNNTIGPLEDRPGRRGSWIGYNTEGFGIIELLTFVEDIGATPVLAVYAGYSLGGKSVPQDQLQPFIDEVIREIDFLTAPAHSNRMGALRASLGRQQPFDIRFVEIGNEDGFSGGTYNYRWPAFYGALSKKFPNITFIATAGGSFQTPPAEDTHSYQVPLFFIKNFRRFETAPRPGPKILAGEFAVINDDDSKMDNPFGPGRISYPSVKSAVAESIYRMGFERNSDVVIGGCYAPVLQNIHYTQWVPNLILFNTSMVVRSTSYLAQQMFGQNVGNLYLNSTAAPVNVSHHHSIRRGEEGDGKLGNLYFVATKHTENNTLIVKFASVDQLDITVNTVINGVSVSTQGTAYLLTAGAGVDPSTVQNTLSNPTAASIKSFAVPVYNGHWSIVIPSWSVVVVTIPL